MWVWQIIRLEIYPPKKLCHRELERICVCSKENIDSNLWRVGNEHAMHSDMNITFQHLHENHWKMLTCRRQPNKPPYFHFHSVSVYSTQHVFITCFIAFFTFHSCSRIFFLPSCYCYLRLFHFELLQCVYCSFSVFLYINWSQWDEAANMLASQNNHCRLRFNTNCDRVFVIRNSKIQC